MDDLKIYGSGTVTSGKYKTISIMGDGTVNGDVECVALNVNGQCDVSGNLKSETVKINGSSSVNGPLETKNIRVNGEIGVSGDLSAEKIRVNGDMDVEGDCDAETCTLRGEFTVAGLLNAGNLKIDLYGPCEVKEIGGEKITVKKEMGFHFLIKNIFASGVSGSKLTTDVIEGDEIRLEHTEANVVRGNDVIIGEGCEIGLVEYRNSFKRNENAKVGRHTKV